MLSAVSAAMTPRVSFEASKNRKYELPARGHLHTTTTNPSHNSAHTVNTSIVISQNIPSRATLFSGLNEVIFSDGSKANPPSCSVPSPY